MDKHAVIQCELCGAGMAGPARNRSGERTCEYCGSVTRRKSIPELAREQGRYLSPKHCPRCHGKTVKTVTMGCHLRACHQCGGLWVPILALQKIGRMPDKSYRELFQLNRSKHRRRSGRATKRHGELRCPACAVVMTQYSFAERTPVVVDVCRRHGVWFDQNEIVPAHRRIARKLGLSLNKPNRIKRDLGLDVEDFEIDLIAYVAVAIVAIVMKLLE